MGSSVPDGLQSSPVKRIFYGRDLVYWMQLSVENFPGHAFIGSCRPLKPVTENCSLRPRTFVIATTNKSSDRELTSCETNTLCVAAARRTLAYLANLIYCCC
jgi:hypothetical protein